MTYQDNHPGKPLAFSYVRMSTLMQLKGDSARRQKELSSRYADEHGLELVEHLHDIGISAFKGKNARTGELGEFLRMMESGEIPQGSYLLVEAFDRLSREEVDDAYDQFRRIMRAGIVIVTLTDGNVYRKGKTDFGNLMYALMSMQRAHEESEIKSARLKASWENKRANIHLRKLTSRCPGWMRLSDDRSHYLLIDEHAKTVRDIFNKAENGFGSYTIARELNASKTPMVGRGKLWIKSYVTKILTDRAVLGEFQNHEKIGDKRIPLGDVLQGYYPCVVSEAQFDRVQALRSRRATIGRGRRGKHFPNLFSGIINCAYCGAAMHLIRKDTHYLRCSKSISTKDCSPATWRYDKFEKSFLYFCRELDLKNIVREGINQDERYVIEEQINAKKQELSQKERLQGNLLRMLEAGNASFDKIQEGLEVVGRQVEILRVELQALEDKRRDAVHQQPSDSALLELIEILKSPDDDQSVAIRNQLKNRISSFVKLIVIGANGNDGLNENIRILFKDRLTGEKKIPYFAVAFHDKKTRIAVINPDDPLDHLILLNEDEHGTAVASSVDFSPIANWSAFDPSVI